ncbi:MAG: von Willebrand factor type A domain-containing protein [Pontiellaceae bacterium]|nr:von Willebrand factor type A domain-containing protein [Pontiellaceae bacterium]MBN2784694.1 von Willebrand factor type A domain-containing protein [Pontiellaceae bacterium]
MKKCRQFEKQLVAYLHGELPEEQGRILQEHLNGCAACAAELEAHRQTVELLDAALVDAPAPATLSPWYAVQRRSRAYENGTGNFWFSPQLKGALAAGAIFALFIVLSGSVVVIKLLPQEAPAPVVVTFQAGDPDEPEVAVRAPIPVKRPVHSELPDRIDHDPDVDPVLADSGAVMPDRFLPDLSGSGAGLIGAAPVGGSDGLVRYERYAMTGLRNASAGHDTEQYNRIPENAFMMSMNNPLSTFSIDVDRAAYANVRRFLNENRMPPPDAVRIEEMINYFVYDYPEPEGDDPFSISLEVAECPWNAGHQLAMVGLQGVKVNTSDLPPNNLVFLLDVSGSMEEPDKLPLLKAGMNLLVDQLRPEDRVSIVVYAGAAGLVLEPTADRDRIVDAIEQLQAGGSTAGGEGIELAYKVARKSFIRNGNNRVILATDGDFNVGVSSDGELVRLIEGQRESGVYLTVLGFGSGNLKDSKLEQLADCGNGNYAYIDDILEARKTLITEMGGTLLTIAEDVKVQVEFNPSQVKAYRLIGYENRLLAQEDFNDDSKDAGELGAGHSVTALYELIPAGSSEKVPEADDLMYQKTQLVESDDLMTVKLRYKLPGADKSRLLVRSVEMSDLISDAPSRNFQFASEVAEFGLLLRNSEYRGNADYSRIIQRARSARGSDDEGYRAEFVRLVEKARLLKLREE